MGADIESAATNVQNTDNIGHIVSWTGTSPVGELFIDISNDKDTATNWTPLDFGSSIAISGNTGSHTINITSVPFSWIRIRYDRTSGTGTLTIKSTMKRVG